MQRADRRFFLRIVGTVVALGLLVYWISQQSWAEIWLAIQQIPLWRLALALGMMLVSRLAVSLRWYMLLRVTNLKLSFLRCVRITMAGLFASNFLPTTVGGDVVRLAGLIQLQKDSALAAASLIADRLVGTTGMMLMLPFSIPALSNIRGSSPPSGQFWHYSIAAAPLHSWIRQLGLRILSFFENLYHSLKIWLRKPDSLLKALFFTGVHMFCLFATIHLLLGGIQEEMPIWLIGGLYSLVYFVTLIPISINGYGVQEISMVLIFTNLGKSSVSGGLTVALLFRTLMMVASLPGAVFLPELLTSKAPEEERKFDRSM